MLVTETKSANRITEHGVKSRDGSLSPPSFNPFTYFVACWQLTVSSMYHAACSRSISNYEAFPQFMKAFSFTFFFRFFFLRDHLFFANVLPICKRERTCNALHASLVQITPQNGSPYIRSWAYPIPVRKPLPSLHRVLGNMSFQKVWKHPPI